MFESQVRKEIAMTRLGKWVILFLLIPSWALADTTEDIAADTGLTGDVVVDAEIADAEPILEQSTKRQKLYFLPGTKSGLVVQNIICARKCATCIAETVKGRDQLRVYRKDLPKSKKFPDGSELLMLLGEPGTEVLLTQTFADPVGVQRTKFKLSGSIVQPDPVKPVVPDPVKPDPPKPVDPVVPVSFDSIHVVIIESPNSTQPAQSRMMQDLRASNNAGADRMTIYDVNGQDETGSQSTIVKAYIANVDAGQPYPYWFVVGVKKGAKGAILKEGSLKSSAEVIDEVRQARRKHDITAKVVRRTDTRIAKVAGYWKTVPCPT